MKKSITAIIGIILFSTTLNSQSNSFDNYQKLWETVAQFELKGLPKSALAEVEKIYIKAKNANNHPQLITNMCHRGTLHIAPRRSDTMCGRLIHCPPAHSPN